MSLAASVKEEGARTLRVMLAGGAVGTAVGGAAGVGLPQPVRTRTHARAREISGKGFIGMTSLALNKKRVDYGFSFRSN
jgi:hypothetical protein